jgi:hypothetical protein
VARRGIQDATERERDCCPRGVRRVQVNQDLVMDTLAGVAAGARASLSRERGGAHKTRDLELGSLIRRQR